MPEEKERPRPHGDPLKGEVGNPRNNPEDNQAQVQSDAPPDVVGGMGRPVKSEADLGNVGGPGAPSREESDRDRGRGSDANGITAFDEADGERRRKRYDDGAELVSRID
jgi:hypothetical protein